MGPDLIFNDSRIIRGERKGERRRERENRSTQPWPCLVLDVQAAPLSRGEPVLTLS